MTEVPRVVPFERLRMRDLEQVGGKNASLGEMIGELAAAGIRVPGGFATTAAAFREFLAHDGLGDRIDAALVDLDIDDVNALAQVGIEIRGWISAAPLPKALVADIERAWAALGSDAKTRLVRRALVGHRRGSARRLIRGSAGNIS